MTARQNILIQIKKTVTDIDPHAQVILYGSRARGNDQPDSDWDLLILTDSQVNYQTEQKFSYPIYELEWETGNVFSVMVKSAKEWESPKYKVSPLYQNIQKDGIKL